MHRVLFVGVSHGWQRLFQPGLTEEEHNKLLRGFAEFSDEQIEQQLRQELEAGAGCSGKPSVMDPTKGLREITSDEFAAFDGYLRKSVQVHGIREILEEACGPPHLRIAALATELRLAHHYCELSKEEREKRGIKTNEQREIYWLSVLKAAVMRFPLLVICGADHVDSFGRLLRASGYETTTLVADYEKTIF